MNPAQHYLVAIDRDPDEADQIAQDTAKSLCCTINYANCIVPLIFCTIELEAKEIKLLDLTKSLGEYLTDEDRTIRAKGLLFSEFNYKSFAKIQDSHWLLLSSFDSITSSTTPSSSRYIYSSRLIVFRPLSDRLKFRLLRSFYVID